MTGITLVIVFHLIVVYALVTGLAQKVVDVVRAPIETKVIEEVKKLLPPPEVALPPPPKLDAPPPPFIPPPEVQLAAPPPPQPAITATTPTPPPAAPLIITPAAPLVSAAAARPAVLAMGVACANQVPPSMPQKAIREGITGSVRARATIKGGKVVAVEILSSQPRGVFDAAVRSAMLQYGCQAGEEEIRAEQTFDFKVD